MPEEDVEFVRKLFWEFWAGLERGDPGVAWDSGAGLRE
jgi:hypothetical protein